MQQKVLILGKVWPEPNSSAAGTRMLELISFFKNLNYFVGFASAAGKSEFSFDLASVEVSEFAIELNDTSFDAFIKNYQPNMVVFDRFTTEEQFGWRVAQYCPNAIRILDTEDLHCLRDARQKAVKEQREFKLNDLLSTTAYREIASIYRCDLTLIISKIELNFLLDFFKIDASLLIYLPFLLDPLSPDEINQLPEFAKRSDFISIGNFLHEPNWDAVLYLKKEIWPKIREQLPHANIQIYGAYPSHKVDQLHNTKEGFYVKGRAKEVKKVMQSAKVLLASLRFGAGLKGKLIDAMLNGTPSVTTSIGAEAMHSDLDWCGEIQNDSNAFAKAAVNLYLNETHWKNAQKQGFEIIENVFPKKHLESELHTRIQLLRTKLEQHRLNNFTGAMLQQHTMQSTKYMALWIEAKNKNNENNTNNPIT